MQRVLIFMQNSCLAMFLTFQLLSSNTRGKSIHLILEVKLVCLPTSCVSFENRICKGGRSKVLGLIKYTVVLQKVWDMLFSFTFSNSDP